jgi:hypothetical protein
VFHEQRGQLRQRYRAGQEDQPGALELEWMATLRASHLKGA